jgi:thiol-disulfide isomerase/thioredoxin
MSTSLVNTIKSRPMFYATIVITCIVLVTASYFVYQNMKPQLNTRTESSSAGGGGGGGSGDADAEILFFSANWCPHCKAAKPHWDQIKDRYSDKTINGYTLVFTEIDCSSETDDVKKITGEYGIEGYPTIKMVKDGQVIDFDAKPTQDTLDKFITTTL